MLLQAQLDVVPRTMAMVFAVTNAATMDSVDKSKDVVMMDVAINVNSGILVLEQVQANVLITMSSELICMYLKFTLQ